MLKFECSADTPLHPSLLTKLGNVGAVLLFVRRIDDVEKNTFADKCANHNRPFVRQCLTTTENRQVLKQEKKEICCIKANESLVSLSQDKAKKLCGCCEAIDATGCSVHHPQEAGCILHFESPSIYVIVLPSSANLFKLFLHKLIELRKKRLRQKLQRL